MQYLKGFVAAVALAVTALSWNSGAHATTLRFTLQGTDYYTWLLDSDPAPNGGSLLGSSFAIAAAPGAPGDALNFFNGSEEGGLNAVLLAGPSEIFDFTGPQLYTGTEDAPHFDTGVFTFVHDSVRHSDAHETLSISLATTPIPAALPLFASALGGLGFVGWRRRKATAA